MASDSRRRRSRDRKGGAIAACRRRGYKGRALLGGWVVKARAAVGLLVALFVLLFARQVEAQTAGVTCFPSNKAKNVNPDTHLVLTFSSAPAIGKSGHDSHLRCGESHAGGHAGYEHSGRARSCASRDRRRDRLRSIRRCPPRRRRPRQRCGPRLPICNNYQLTTIGGLADFHFYPVIVHGNVATIYPHNHVLQYGHRYIVGSMRAC